MRSVAAIIYVLFYVRQEERKIAQLDEQERNAKRTLLKARNFADKTHDKTCFYNLALASLSLKSQHNMFI